MRLPSRTLLQETAGTAWDADVCHIVCCDDNLSWCGEVLAGAAWAPADGARPECPLCRLAQNLPCPFGCNADQA